MRPRARMKATDEDDAVRRTAQQCTFHGMTIQGFAESARNIVMPVWTAPRTCWHGCLEPYTCNTYIGNYHTINGLGGKGWGHRPSVQWGTVACICTPQRKTTKRHLRMDRPWAAPSGAERRRAPLTSTAPHAAPRKSEQRADVRRSFERQAVYTYIPNYTYICMWICESVIGSHILLTYILLSTQTLYIRYTNKHIESQMHLTCVYNNKSIANTIKSV
jgi:hypothetical protein